MNSFAGISDVRISIFASIVLIRRERPAENASILDFSCVCPEPVLAKDHFSVLKWLEEGVVVAPRTIDPHLYVSESSRIEPASDARS
jgi:hypothetical protein